MISVIIPALNEEKYIKTCIQSLKTQTTKTPYEIIVVDNNSTDHTKEVALETGTKLLEEHRPGVAAAKNTGAKNAGGDILCFIDADCIVPNNHLEKIETLFSKHQKMVAMGGPYFYSDGGVFIKLATGLFDYFYYYHKLVKLVSGVQSMAGGNMVIKKDTFEKIGGFNENIRSINQPEDLEISTRLSKVGEVGMFKSLRVTSSFRRYDGKVNKDAVTRLFESIKVLIKAQKI